jgi:hypothetical protein
MFSPHGEVSADTLAAAIEEEVVAWTRLLSPAVLSHGPSTTRYAWKRGSNFFFESENEPGETLLSKGLVGRVLKIDEDVDARVDFGEDIGEAQWVSAHNFL